MVINIQRTIDGLIKEMFNLLKLLSKKASPGAITGVFITMAIVVALEILWLTALLTVWFMWQLGH